MKKIILKVLKALAKTKVRRMTPTVIGVTGSFGKTTMKEVISEVLATKYRVLKSEKSLNTDIGMCLAILEQKSGFSSPVAWGGILVKGFLNAFFSPRVDFFVLEYGVDKPGDMGDLLDIVRPTVAVVTAVSAVHQAPGQFKNIDQVTHEKGGLARAVNKEGLVILNHANDYVRTIAKGVVAKTMWYNDEKSLASAVSAKTMQGTEGIEVSLMHNHKKHDFFMPVIGEFHGDCVQVAYLVAQKYEVAASQLREVLAHFVPPPGRMSLIEGLHGTTIIDSTYNASPETVKNALEILKNFPSRRRIAVLGSMNELGAATHSGHVSVAHSCSDWLDVLITVGESAKIIADECLNKPKKPGTIISLETAAEAAEYLKKTLKIQAGDVVLMKGSQNKVRLERAVKALMKHSEKAAQLLCRQEREWLAKE